MACIFVLSVVAFVALVLAGVTAWGFERLPESAQNAVFRFFGWGDL